MYVREMVKELLRQEQEETQQALESAEAAGTAHQLHLEGLDPLSTITANNTAPQTGSSKQ